MKRILLIAIAATQLHGAILPRLTPSTVHFQTGPEAKALMAAVTNYQLPWNHMGNCPPLGGSCQTNGTITISQTLSATIFSPQNWAFVGPDGTMETLQYVDIKFSAPISGFGLDLEDAYRFTWMVGLEAFDATGGSLGKIEQTGFEQVLHPPTIYFAALADQNAIWSIRIYTNYGTAPEGYIFNAGVASIAQQLPPARGVFRRRAPVGFAPEGSGMEASEVDEPSIGEPIQ